MGVFRWLVPAGDLGRAVPLSEAVLADRTRVLGPDHRDTFGSRSNLAVAYFEEGRLAKAVPLSEAVLNDTVRELGPDHPLTVTVARNLIAVRKPSFRRRTSPSQT